MAALTPEASLRVTLIADVTFNALVSGRVWPRTDVPQDDSRPYSTYFRVSAQRDHQLLASSGHPSTRIQIEHWSTDFDETRDMGDAARLALNGFNGTVTSGADSTVVEWVKLDDEGAVIDLDVPGRDRQLSGLRQDYLVRYIETVPTF